MNIIKEPITLTDGAVEQLSRLMHEKEVAEGHSLRVGVKGGGCAGFSYILGFDLPKESDEVYTINGCQTA